jgi:tetratricopeptide (TPR) repeat protein
MEYSRMGQIDEALAGFDAVLAANPDYVAAYYHAGQTLERSSREQDARLMYARGIAVADRLGDMKTRSELQAALDILG